MTIPPFRPDFVPYGDNIPENIYYKGINHVKLAREGQNRQEFLSSEVRLNGVFTASPGVIVENKQGDNGLFIFPDVAVSFVSYVAKIVNGSKILFHVRGQGNVECRLGNGQNLESGSVTIYSTGLPTGSTAEVVADIDYTASASRSFIGFMGFGPSAVIISEFRVYTPR